MNDDTGLLLERSHANGDDVLRAMESRNEGLTGSEAASRLDSDGPNRIASQKPRSWWMRFFDNLENPLVLLLAALGALSWLTGDLRAAAVIFAMVVLGVVLRFFQEIRADRAAEMLKAMVSNTATLVRDGEDREIALGLVVRGDIVRLAAGDMVPADVRLLSAKDLFVNQAALTGESMPVERNPLATQGDQVDPLALANICYLGSNVVSGSATAVVVRTGDRTYLGALATGIARERQATSFDKGINGFTWLMIRFMAVMVPAVFLINGLVHHSWLEAFLFAMAVAVGLTPEMLPMIVTVNLSKGALAMSRRKVIVKRLNAIQDLGAMDVLCTDKTGTLTQGRVVLEKHLDARGDESEKVLHYGYMNSYYHTGLKNLLDEAVLAHDELEAKLEAKDKYRKIDEIPFDFSRRRMSVVVEDLAGLNILICKGAVEEVLAACSRVDVGGEVIEILPEHDARRRKLADDLNGQGFRVVALAYKTMPGATDEPTYAVKDESDLVLLGFLAFLDPPKDSAKQALQRLGELNVEVKVLTGDNEIVTSYICRQVGIPVENILLGPRIEGMSDAQLEDSVAACRVFARLAPAHKERIIRALQGNGRVVGFMGDGINDAPALKAADVGVSVDGAVDIAKESSDIILLENSLLVLEQGVLEGRRVFGNIVKYIKMAASSNFGNMFSVVGASAFLPFLPMRPIQLLTNNLLYDFSQTAIPTDDVDADWLRKPRKWELGGIVKFMLILGPVSSIFDYLTFFVLLQVFHCWNDPDLFRTGWFVESICTQILVIHVIRTNKIPFFQSRSSWPLGIASVLVVAAGAWLPVSPLAGVLGFVPLPGAYWIWLAGILAGYVALAQLVKSWFYRRFPE